MSEEKKLEGMEETKEEPTVEQNLEESVSPENPEQNAEKVDVDGEEKAKEAQSQILSATQPVGDDVSTQVKDVADLDNMEDQIQKLTEIASQEGPQKALKIAKTLNSNYAIDEMHDRLIDEEELRKALILKGFIEDSGV